MISTAYENARVAISRVEELFAVDRLKMGGYELTILGRPGWLVNYEDLAYATSPGEISREMEKLLSAYLADGAKSHSLARLSGSFLILAARGGGLQRVITSDEFPNRVYFYRRNGILVLSDDPFAFARSRAPLDPGSYDAANLRYLGRKKTCIPGQTYVRSLFRLRPATIYHLQGADLIPVSAVYYRNTRGRVFTCRDFYQVVGRRLERADYSLCYSTGIDSHHLLMAFGDRIRDVNTVCYQAPHQDSERSQEAAAGLINAARANKPFHIVPVSHAEEKNLPLLRHAVNRDPFASHYSYSQYQLFARARCSRVMTGQNADTLQFFGLTSPIPWRHLGGKSRIPNYRTTWERVVYRQRVQASFGRLKDPGILNRRLFNGYLDKVQSLVGPDGYWAILYFKMINNMTSGNTALFRNAAAYHGKKVFFPYIEPLVFHVSAYLRRRLLQILNPKKFLRKRYHYLQHKRLSPPPPRGLPFDQSRVFAQVSGEMDQLSKPLRAYFDSLLEDPVARVFVYQFVLQTQAEEF